MTTITVGAYSIQTQIDVARLLDVLIVCEAHVDQTVFKVYSNKYVFNSRKMQWKWNTSDGSGVII
jgi:hypothetical protein